MTIFFASLLAVLLTYQDIFSSSALFGKIAVSGKVYWSVSVELSNLITNYSSIESFFMSAKNESYADINKIFNLSKITVMLNISVVRLIDIFKRRKFKFLNFP